MPRVSRLVWRVARDTPEMTYAASRAGLAAQQEGVHQRLIVADVGPRPITLLTPGLTAADREQVE